MKVNHSGPSHFFTEGLIEFFLSLFLEQAFWILICIIDRLLPANYFSPSLVGSRADQLVLSQIVAQILPKLHAHFLALGVDLASITFGWFLSLFTDCLPVEVSRDMRLWEYEG